jgi:glycosyltransferase involved in cell wall biosynthesis
MRLVFIGAINNGNRPKGGEEYKNQILITKINSVFNDAKIIDTYEWIKIPKVWWSLFLNIFIKGVDIVLISASSVSTYRLLNLLQWIKPSVLKKCTYLVIGGYFPEGIRSKRFNWKYYKHLRHIVIEGKLMQHMLVSDTKLTNIKVIPNFKKFPKLNFEFNETKNIKCRFVFVGRISKGKGISEIIDAVKILNRTKEEFTVDFYGPVEEEFNFDSNETNYCGFLDFQNDPVQAYTKLASYDCMLFPTYWKGEGFPGVIIDAFIAGLPVIATDWNMNTEIIEDGINGFIIPPFDTVSLANKMMWVMDNRETLITISARNKKKAKQYHIDSIWPELLEIIK